MLEKRVKINEIVQNQIPLYVSNEFPLISNFLEQYYIAQEFQGAPIDLIQNIDQYIKVDQLTNLTESVVLGSSISFDDETITVDPVESPSGTDGFPDSYGLIKINDEIITYTGKTDYSFTGCIRGFSGVTSYKEEGNPESLVFEESESAEHTQGSTISNLSILFLKEFLLKVKYQLLPGFEDREFSSDLNENLFIKNSKDFYLSKGTDRSFEILFKALYDEEVKIIRPGDFLLTPSNAHYIITNDIVVESFEGNPEDLENSTLFQDSYGDQITKAYAPITSVEKIVSGIGNTFYKLSLDAGYDRDITVDGAVYGDFSVIPKTKVIGQVSSGSTYFEVDSTVGFPTSGELYVTYDDQSSGVISYTSKSLTQFFGCSNIIGTILDSENVGINTYAYGTSFRNQNEIIKVKINSVLNSLDYPDNTKYYRSGNTARIRTLGVSDSSFKAKNWFYNISPIYNVKNLELLDDSDKTYRVTLNVDNYFRIGDSAVINGSDGVSRETIIIDVNSSRTFSIKGQGDLPLNARYTIKRNILRGVSNTFSSASKYVTNIQNLYKDKNDSKLLVASSSIPSYNLQPLNVSNRLVLFSGTFIGDEFKITENSDHGFYTGDAVYYTPEKITESYFDENGDLATREVVNSILFEEGLYYVHRINSTTIKLSRSRNDIYLSKFISLDNPATVSNNKLEPYDLRFKTLESQKILREIALPLQDGETTESSPGYTGILINGVEILNYKSKDVVYYGGIDDIEVISPGSNYDILNPPLLSITDEVGVGATGFPAVSGSLREIRILDSGFDYIETPTIKITGGNGTGAVASVNMKLIDHSSSFNADAPSKRIGIGSTLSTIGFGTYHKFKNAEQVIYITNSQKSVSGIITNSSYFVSTEDEYTIKLHKTEEDAIAGINTIVLSGYGEGVQSFKSINKKSVVDSINVVSSGFNYQNKKRTCSSSGISTSLNLINIKNHDYNSGEIVKYTCEGTEVGGLTNGSEYYLTKINDDEFKLSNVGSGSTSEDFFYRTNQYINFSSVGVGTHIFNYQDITVSLSGEIGISSVGSETFQAKIQPIFRGEITSVHLSDSGSGYGFAGIINFNKQPNISLVSGEDAQLFPVVNDGKIIEVLVLNSGKKYNSPPNLVINGDGIGAVLTPVIENGLLTSVNVISQGSGYTQGNTSVEVLFPGSGAELKSNIQKWNINLFQKNITRVTSDDGFIENGINENFGLQYCHIYAPRRFREIVYSVNQSGETLYGKKDLRTFNGIEVASSDHSPIIGWAYDGNPIYGPYGYSTKRGGVISQMKSGYELKLKPGRPPTSLYPEGFFVEDFTHSNVSDESVLDEHNGRFCVTPEFPEGTYAYFATINEGSADSSGTFSGFKRPKFPYFIGNSFKSTPNEFNFKKSSNQDDYDLNNEEWYRNTQPYNLIEGNLRYQYFDIPNDLSQTIDIESVSPGTIDSIGINSGGNLYQVGDQVVFNNENTSGSGASVEVSKILGKSVNNISVASSTISDLEVYPGNNKGEYILFANHPHNFNDKDFVVISGLSTTSSKIGGNYSAKITTNTLDLVGVGSLSSGIGSDGVTGIVTYLNVSGNLSYPNIRENDILTIENEKLKVLNVSPETSRIRVIRSFGGTIGTGHSVGSAIIEDPRKLYINAGFNTTYDYRINKQIYFNPIESIGLGSSDGVGIGTTIFFSNPGTGLTQLYIPTRTVYIKNHNLLTGDQLTYSPNGGSGIEVLVNSTSGISTLVDQETLYVAKISDDLVGLSTVKVGLSTTGTFVGIASTFRESSTLFFVGVGTGNYHSFETNYDVITANVTRNNVTVSTGDTHGLSDNDEVFVSVNPAISTSVVVKYNDYNRKIIINPITFSSSGISTENNSITISNHKLETGQKVIYTSNTPSEGLIDNQIYYIIKVDDDTIKLSDTYYNSRESKPVVVGINSASIGTINPINPPITAYKDTAIIFDVSDSSLSYLNQSTRYPAFKLNFYTDENYTKIWEKSPESSTFNVLRNGTVGVSADANVILDINENTPEILYYKLDTVFESDLPIEKEQSSVDDEVASASQIISTYSIYNGKKIISVASTNTFTYSLSEYPERSSYTSNPSIIEYTTNSSSAYGSIKEFEIKNPGRNYYSLPGISTINSNFGNGAIIDAFSESIGKIKKSEINDIGFDFPSDKTLSPNVLLPQIVKVDPLTSIDFIGITSVGRGYVTAPKLLVFDGKTEELVSDLDLNYNIGDNQVTILKNTFGMSNTQPRILPVENSNGVGISTVLYNSSTKDVTVILSVGFSTANIFPFSVGDKVLVENVSVGVGSTGKGYNSDNYNYELFTLTDVDENRGGIGSVTYSLSGLIEDGLTPGVYDFVNSSGRIIPEKYFPQFNVSLKTNNYVIGETVKSNSSTGIVEEWDPVTTILKISSKDSFEEGNIIEGLSSNTQGLASSITSFDSYLKLDSFSRVRKGWQSNSGILNDNLQRVQDSYYYQRFSYSLSSKIPYETWNDVVSATNHTLGFKKFADFQLESSLDEQNKNSMVVGLSTFTTSFDVIVDYISVMDLNCVYDFDLVSENYLNINSNIVSDQIEFNSRILTDYFKSVGNRVLSIDDVSGQFNSNPRPTAFNVVNTFKLNDVRAQKYFVYIKDVRFFAQRQLTAVTLVHDMTFGYLNQYGRIDTVYDLGYFDFTISGDEGKLLFYPVNYTVNDYDVTCVCYNLDDSLTGIGSTQIGNIALINTDSTVVPSGTPTTIVGIADTYRSVKVLVEITSDAGGSSNEYEFEELNIIHDGIEAHILEYGELTTNLGYYTSSGFGTYSAYLDSSLLKVDFIPNSGIGLTATVNTIQVALSDESVSGIGTVDLKHTRIEARTTSIGSSTSPVENVIGEYPDEYDSAYFIVQVSDTTNNTYQMSEVLVVDDYLENDGSGTTYDTEYGIIETVSGLGTIGTRLNGAGIGSAANVQLTFTPLPNIDTQVRVYMNALRYVDDEKEEIDFNNGSIESVYSRYEGTDRDIKRSFNLTHLNNPIFDREFDGSDNAIVNLTDSSIRIPNHFFVSGENVNYIHAGFGSTQAIGIAETSFSGIGTTSFLPSDLYIVKVNEDKVQLASSAENALKETPEILTFTHVGIGTSHRFIAKNQNAKVVLSLDNIIQSPIVSTAVSTTLARQVLTTDDLVYFSGITSFFGGDLIKIGDEIMKIEGVGIGSTNAIRVRRPWLGTNLSGYSTGDFVTKIIGNYNIVENTLNFTEAPYGNVPIGTITNPPDDRDWVGISTGSSFHGRVFLRSGVPNTSDEAYHKNYVFDDISQRFDGTERSFELKSDGDSISGISSENAIILINDIFQQPGLTNNYVLNESAGITTITFTGTATSISSDVNTSNLPVGGVIVSVGSTEGFGYQPLVSAGGTAIVSISGTIQSISIGNSGSGYRSGIQTVRVGVQTFSAEGTNIEFIGTASVSGGNVVSVAITNSGSGYTSTNPPIVIFDDPLSYSNIPLIYSNSSVSGFGSNATIDIVVGQGSSVTDFIIKNTGYGYGNGEILTVDVGGSTGIPTTSGFNEFQISIQNIFTDEFTGWSVGTLESLDNIERYFDGDRSTFPLSLAGNIVSIISERGSNINVQDVLLVFVNDILQVPGEGYTFQGGSNITFTEPPKVGDTAKILFYKGSGDVDVVFTDIISTVKDGDILTIENDPENEKTKYLLGEDPRGVVSLVSANIVETNPYFGPGNSQDETLLRPVTWCRQTEDKIINEKEVGKDRELYEPVINPFSYILKTVGVGSTSIFVDSLIPIFNSQNENDINLDFQKEVTIISQDPKVGASLSAIVSNSGSISSIVINDGGFGYSSAPEISIQSPTGIGTIAIVSASISSGIVTSVNIINPGSGYTTDSQPLVLVETPTLPREVKSVISYSGDNGIIVGFGTTTITNIDKFIFDFYIPENSFLRNSTLVGSAITISSINTGDYFIVYESTAGVASTSIYSRSLEYDFVGYGTQFIDNVYQVDSAETVVKNISGLGTVYARRVFTRISGIGTVNYSSTLVSYDSTNYTTDDPGVVGSGFTGVIIDSSNFGKYSWGRIQTSPTIDGNTFNFYGNDGITGIKTSSIVKRSSSLKYSNYII